MFKVLSTTATVALATRANSDFFQGAQTAIFLKNEEDFKDYSCPEPEMSEEIEKYIGMIEPVKAMLGGSGKKNKKGSKKSEPLEVNPMAEFIDKITAYGEQMGIIMSVSGPNYEGGDFCAGLTATFEAKQIAFDIFKSMFKGGSTGSKDSYLQ